MKTELDNVPTEETAAHSPEIISPTFRSNLSKFGINNMRKEELLRFNLLEAETKLQGFLDQSRMIKCTLKEQTSVLMHKTNKNREVIERLEKHLEKLEQSSVNMNMALKKQNQQKVEAFKVALKPLQDVIEMLADNKSAIEAKLSVLNEKLDNYAKQESECLDQLNGKYLEDQKLENHKRQILEQLEEMKKFNPWDYKEFIQDKEIRESLNRAKENKKSKVKELNEMDKVIADLTSQSDILVRDIETLRASSISTELISKNETELIQLEEFLNLQCENFSGPQIRTIIEELCILGNFPVKQMIFKEQFRLMEHKELEMIEFAKNQQETYEREIIELNKTVEELEVEIYALISVQQSDSQLEKQLKRTEKERDETKAKAKKFAKDHACKIEAIKKWKEENRNILLISSNERVPTDDHVIQEFYERLRPFISNPEHWRAMESVILRYCEKARERDSMQESVMSQKLKETSLIETKSEALKRVRAIKTTKETERSLVHSEFEKLVLLEKKTLKELESSKLEVESARKSFFKEQLQATLANNSSFSRIQKTYGDKAIKKLIEKETNELKVKIEKDRSIVKEHMEALFAEKVNWDKTQGLLKKEISENFQTKLNEIQYEMQKLQAEKKKIEKEHNLLAEAEDEAHSKLDSLAEHKKSEIVKEAKRVVNSHGGERNAKIEQLYSLRHRKESEIAQLEGELIKIECGLTEKETAAELEIVRLRSRIKNIKDELSQIEKSKKHSETLEKSISKIEISNSGFASDLSLASDSPPIRKSSPVSKSESSPDLLKFSSPCELLSPADIQEDIKDADEESVQRQHVQQGVYLKNLIKQIDEEGISEVSSELPCPPEPQYRYDKADIKNRAFFEAIIPMIEGTIIYKLFKAKSTHQFDPLEARVYTPEDCGFGVRKMKLNKQMGKIEIRQVGKNGVESSIIVDQILSVGVPALTTEIIKARARGGNQEEHNLEKSEEYSKAYRNMKAMGKVDYASQVFCYKAKETRFFPFFFMLKAGRVELVAEGLEVYRLWLHGINMLVKNKAELERLKFKITQA